VGARENALRSGASEARGRETSERRIAKPNAVQLWKGQNRYENGQMGQKRPRKKAGGDLRLENSQIRDPLSGTGDRSDRLISERGGLGRGARIFRNSLVGSVLTAKDGKRKSKENSWGSNMKNQGESMLTTIAQGKEVDHDSFPEG